MTVWVIPDLDLADLSLWLVDINAGPVVCFSFCATISTILQSELVLVIIEYFIERNNIVVIIELVDCWEVSVLLALDWQVRIRKSVSEFLSFNCDNMLSTNANRYFFRLLELLI